MDCHEIVEENMLVGEERWLTYKVISCSPEKQEYTIQDATYEIPGFAEDGGDVSGNCVIDDEDKTIKVKVKPVRTGYFTLTFTIMIADEVIKLKVKLHVCE